MTIETLAKNLELWRKTKSTRGERIPQEYWEEAVVLAKGSSPSVVANKLKLNLEDLKKRMGVVDPKREKTKIQFKELSGANFTARPIIELSTTSGITLKVYQ